MNDATPGSPDGAGALVMPLATQPCLLRPCATRSRDTCAVRIAFSGAQRVGKTTLIERVAEALPGYALVPEPYHLLQEDGYDFADPPSAEDFEAQLERSIVELEEAGECALLDRCPADLLAYLLVGDHDVNAQLERCREAIGLLDLVVLVPIEEPDRIAVSSHEDREQRRAVDEELFELLLDEGLAEEVLPVHGDVTTRVAQVLRRVNELDRSNSHPDDLTHPSPSGLGRDP